MKKVISPSIALLLACWNLNASTMVWDTGAGAGIQAGNGTWDFNTTGNWTANGGTTRVNWIDNADTALFQLTGTQGTVTIGAGQQVGAHGLLFTGSVGSTSGTWTVGASGGTNSIQLGSGGVSNKISDGFLRINAPIVLTESQTWSSTKLSNNSGAAGVTISGPISSLSGTTNLTFDGRGLANPTATANSSPRVIFSMAGSNSYVGSTILMGGAELRLDYVSNAGGKLDDTSALVLGGSSIALNGGAGIEERVGSTVVSAGANTIFAGPNGGGTKDGVLTNRILLGDLSRNVGGTLDLTTAVTAIASTTTLNTNGIIGGWATVGGVSWAVGSEAGDDTVITSTNGTSYATVASWATDGNINATAGGALTGDKVINALRFASNSPATIDLAGSSLTVTSGGIINNRAGNTITGGQLKSGMSTGELFVHTPTALTIGSNIANNGSTPTVLVKGGTDSLTLTGTNSYTGGTIVNSGTLIVGGGGSIVGSVTVQGGATFDVTANGFSVSTGQSLIGSGTVVGNISIANGGALSAGTAVLDAQGISHHSSGTLSLGNNLTLLDGSVVNLTLGTNSDLILLTNASAVLTGSTLEGGITFNLSGSEGIAVSQVYTLLQWQSGTSLSNFDLSDFSVSGLSGTFQFGTNSLEFVVTAIPEPSTYALLILGFGVAFWMRRLRQRTATI